MIFLKLSLCSFWLFFCVEVLSTKRYSLFGVRSFVPFLIPVLHNVQPDDADVIISILSRYKIDMFSISLRHSAAMDSLNRICTIAHKNMKVGVSTVRSIDQVLYYTS